MTRALTALALVAMLVGCTSGEVKEVGAFAAEDLDNARLMADRVDDAMALQCYDFLAPRLAAMTDAQEGERISGPVSAYQKARNVRRFIEATQSDEFRMACGPMLMDSETAARKLISEVLKLF